MRCFRPVATERNVRIAELMTPNPETVQPEDTLQTAAQKMDDLNVGVLPVVAQDRLLGVLTDRDIVVRSTAAGQDPRQATVADAMTGELRTLTADAAVPDAIAMMKAHQLRRVLVVDAAGALVGVVSVGDLASAGLPETGDLLEAISTPAEPDR